MHMIVHVLGMMVEELFSFDINTIQLSVCTSLFIQHVKVFFYWNVATFQSNLVGGCTIVLFILSYFRILNYYSSRKKIGMVLFLCFVGISSYTSCIDILYMY